MTEKSEPWQVIDSKKSETMNHSINIMLMSLAVQQFAYYQTPQQNEDQPAIDC